MKKIFVQIALAFLLSASAFSQNRQDQSKTYWLKHSLIFFKDCMPRVFPDNIIFTEGDCSVSPYQGDILSKGFSVEMDYIGEESGFAKILFKYKSKSYEVLLKNDSPKNFRKTFDLLFSRKMVSEARDCGDIKTRKQVIKCLGFPISVTRDGDVEKYFYILEFVGQSPFSSYDGFTIKIKNKKVIDVSGYI